MYSGTFFKQNEMKNYLQYILYPGILCCIALISIAADPLYTGSLSGRITEKGSGKAISNATIYINDLKLGVAADSAGFYSLKNLPSGNFLVEIRSVGYKAITRNVKISGPVTENFVLEENVVEESEVVVTGLSKATQIKRSPIPIVTVNHNAIVSNINTNIIDAITKLPGITAVTTGPNVSKPYIRGLGFNRILTLYDGVRQEGQQWGDEHGIEVDQYSIDRIEVVKGPASLSYGSDALAGVVNLIPTQPAPEGKTIGEIIGEYQTNNRQIAGTGMLKGTKNGLEWMGRFSHKQATNYSNKIDGRVYGTSFNETDATAYLGIHRKWGFSHLSFSLFDDLQKIPDGSRDSASRKFTKQITEIDSIRPIVSEDELTSYSISGLHQHIRHYRVYSNNSFTVGSGRMAINMAFQKSIRQEFNHPEYTDIAGLNLDLKTYNYDLKYYFQDFDGWNFTVGANGMYQQNDVTKGTDFVIPSYQQFDIGPFLLVKKSFDKIDISGGVRYDHRSFSSDELYIKPNSVTGFDEPVKGIDTVGADKPFSNYSHNFSGASGSLGFTYNPTEKLTFKANISRGFRAPNISEISSNGVHPGTNIYQIGNAAFKPEFSFQEDIGFVFTSHYMVINMNIFYNTIKNYIFNQKLISATGEDSTIVPGNQTFKYQQGQARLYGGEMNIDFHPVKPLHFENSFSIVFGDNREVNGVKLNDDSKYLPFIPPFHGLSELRYDFDSKQHQVRDGFVKAQLVYYGAQNRVYAADGTETPTPGYAYLNLGMGTGFANKKGKTVMTLSLLANNIFDLAYQDHLNRLKYFEPYASDPRPYHGIYNMGRNIAIKLLVPLEF
jgi:iron complex outermembrane receptor protein